MKRPNTEITIQDAGSIMTTPEAKPRFYALLDQDGGCPAGVEIIEFGPAKDGESRNTNRIVFVMERAAEIVGATVFDEQRLEIPSVKVTGVESESRPRCSELLCHPAGQEIVFEPGSIIGTIQLVMHDEAVDPIPPERWMTFAKGLRTELAKTYEIFRKFRKHD